jgi:hypothetical protein
VAWSEQTPVRIRSFVSDSLYERLVLELDIQKSCGIRTVWSEIEIRNVRVARIDSNPLFDHIHFQVTARASVGILDPGTGERIMNLPGNVDVFSEYWSFLRRRGAKTLAKPGMIEGFCPKCGTRIAPGSEIECAACHAVLCSGDSDWLLYEIRPVSERLPVLRNATFATHARTDRAFCEDHAKDRARCLFFRIVAARFFADNRYLDPMASKRFLDEHRCDFTPLADGRHQIFTDVTLCSVETLDFRPADAPGTFDEVRILMKWTGREISVLIPSRILPNPGDQVLSQQVFRMIRKTNAASPSEMQLKSAHCPNCGMWEIRSDGPRCGKCGITLNDGLTDWILDGISPFREFPHPIGTTRFDPVRITEVEPDQQTSTLPTYDHETLVASLAAILLPNGPENDCEDREPVGDFARIKGVSVRRLYALLDADRNGRGTVLRPETIDDARVFVRSLVHVCLADGKLSVTEEKLLQRLVRKMGYATWDIPEIAERERTHLSRIAERVMKKTEENP